MSAQTKPRLRNLDDLFGLGDNTTQSNEPIQLKRPVTSGNTSYSIVPLTQIDDYPNHPFRLYEGERESDMIESIRANGILQPLILREIDGGRYQLLSGHNRKHAGIKAGLAEAPAFIKRNLSEDEALMYVVETNLMQRSFTDMAHSEKAAVIAAQHSKLFSQGKRNDILEELRMLENPHGYRDGGTSTQVAKKLTSIGIVGDQYNLSKDTVARYLRINKLIPALKTRLDNGEFAFVPAVSLSFLKGSEQELLDKCIELNEFPVDMKKADMLREYSAKSKLDEDNIYLILSGEVGIKPKPNRTPVVKVSKAVYTRYFKPSQPAREIQDIVEKALDMYFGNL